MAESDEPREWTAIPRDTSLNVYERQIEAYRAMDPSQKIKVLSDIIHFVRETQREAIRKIYPDADEHEVKMRLASRWISPELMKAAYGWDVSVEGY